MRRRLLSRWGLSFIAAVVLVGAAAYFFLASQGGDPCRLDPGPWRAAAQTTPVRCGYVVAQTYPHDPRAFTEGLTLVDGVLYEGTGTYSLPQSALRRVRLETGEVLQEAVLPVQFFGEGVTVLGGQIYQLTWQSHQGFIYDRVSFKLLRTFTYASEGWGLTNDGQRLIMSDGTPTLHFIDPGTLREVGQVTVHDPGGPVTQLNELEYVHGQVYANVWHTERLARIDPATGAVTAWIDLSGLLAASARPDPEAVLNGIAYDAGQQRLLVTGKLWPTLFAITLRAQP